jgi:DNA polymerase/3'-5' exonuclease PolX
MSAGTKLSLADARRVADKLVDRLAPACERIEVAGSIRRGKAEVGDIELVAIPRFEARTIPSQLSFLNNPMPAEQVNLFNEELSVMLDLGMIWRNPPRGVDAPPAWGERYKKCWLQVRPGQMAQVDLFIADARNWGAIFAIRTGPHDFSQALVTRLKYNTPYRQHEGYLIHKETGEVIAVPEEADYFRLADVPWIEPGKRSTAMLGRMLVGRAEPRSPIPRPSPKKTP